VPSTYVLTSLTYVKNNMKGFKLREDIHSHNTRGKRKIDKPKTRLELVKRSYLNQGIELFNLLPPKIQELTNIGFKKTLKKLLIEAEGYSIHEIYNFILGLTDDKHN
jgi:hypothetical protein